MIKRQAQSEPKNDLAEPLDQDGPAAPACSDTPHGGSAPESYGRRVTAPRPIGLPKRRPADRTCLLVDDSRMIRKVARKIVEGRGYKISEAENGQEALEKCKAAMPDLVILDWDMPVMTGIEFLAVLRELETTARQPKVVFCTTHNSAMDVHKAVDYGADEFVTKPFSEESLVGKLRNIGAA